MNGRAGGTKGGAGATSGGGKIVHHVIVPMATGHGAGVVIGLPATDRAATDPMATGRGVAGTALMATGLVVLRSARAAGTGLAVARAGGGNNQCFALPAQAWYN